MIMLEMDVEGITVGSSILPVKLIQIFWDGTVEFGGIEEPPSSRRFDEKQSPVSQRTPTITHANVRPSTSSPRKEVWHTDWSFPAPKQMGDFQG
jgi:hypothetical protein